MVDVNNRVRFLSVRRHMLYLSKNFIQIPGEFKKLYKDENQHAILLI